MSRTHSSALTSRLRWLMTLFMALALIACSPRLDEVKLEQNIPADDHPAPSSATEAARPPAPAPAARPYPAPVPSQAEAPAPTPGPTTVPRRNDQPRTVKHRFSIAPAAGAEAPPAPVFALETEADLDTWLARVSAPERIVIPGPPQLMRVWIGAPDSKPAAIAGSRSSEVVMPVLSHAVKITPIAPGLEISPAESVCETIHESGSEVVFSLKASKRGTYTVGAQVALYENPDCTGKRIPKTTNTVQVEVAVDVLGEAREAGDQARKDSFDAILALWKEILGILAATLILVFRKRLGQLLGIKQE